MGNCLRRASSEVHLEDPVDLTHFNLRRTIGQGAYGKVCTVEKRDTKQLFAMKYINKEMLVETDTVLRVAQENDIMINVDHPNIIKLWYTFQDEEDIFMVTDLCLAGDLGHHIEKYGRISFDRVKLYVAEAGMALDYLKSKSIIHRDIKPANLLLNDKGHVVVTDFNIAVIVAPGLPINSLSGTSLYMAPEIFAPPPEGYSYAIDWWSLGVSAYEMLGTQHPFTICENTDLSKEEIAEHIGNHRNLQMSAIWDSRICAFLRELIQPDVSRRISSIEDLKKCIAVYEGEDWNAIESQTFIPPYVPRKDVLDCDPSFEFNELILESNPLRKKQKRLKGGRSKNNNEPVTDPTKDVSHLFMPYSRIKSLDMTGKPLSVEREVMEEMSRSAGASNSTRREWNRSSGENKRKHKASVASNRSNNSDNRRSSIAAKHKISIVSICGIGNRSNSEGIPAQSFPKGQKKRLSCDSAALIKQKVSDDGSSDDEPLATKMTTVELEN